MRAIRYFLYVLLDTIQTMPKLLRQCKTVILDAAVLVTGRVFAAGAGLLAQKYVCDAGGFKFLLQIFSIELGFIRL